MVGASHQNGEAESGTYTVRSQFYAPPAEFDGCLPTFYHLTLCTEEGNEISDQLQPEWGNIRFFCGAAPNAQIGSSRVDGAHFGATGPSSQPLHFSLGASRMWGIGFLPLGWARFVNVNARDMANVVVEGSSHPAFAKFADLSEVLCNPDCSEQQQLEAIIAKMRELAQPHRDEDKIVRVHRTMVDESLASVAEFAERSGLSIRSLERICSRHFGFTPKLLMRLQRFMRSLTSFMLRKSSNWTEVMDEHYHDQSQFTREFRAFMGMLPSQYAAMEHPIIASFVEARARIWGSAAQTLDRPA